MYFYCHRRLYIDGCAGSSPRDLAHGLYFLSPLYFLLPVRGRAM
jgi:hypothetical protein